MTGIIGHRTATCGIATADNEVSRTCVAEVKTIANVFARRKTAKVVHILIKGQFWHLHRVVITLCTLRITNQVNIGIRFTPLATRG